MIGGNERAPLEEIMETFQAKAADMDSYTIYVVPHSHIDVEWYWDYPETIRKVNAIFGSALQLIRRDPEYNFSQDQVLCIEPFLERLSGSDREEFVRLCREGRFEVVGGMYVQPEVAEPCGESLIRQILIGKQWFKDNLGLEDVPVAWNSDTFSQVSQLPQILAKSGFGYNGCTPKQNAEFDRVCSLRWTEFQALVNGNRRKRYDI